MKTGRWRTPEAFLQRRIITLYSEDGATIGFRVFIQQGHGSERVLHSEVFRVNERGNESVSMALAQSWRDQKELELGITNGVPPKITNDRFISGISLVIPNGKPPRPHWKWVSSGHPRTVIYITKARGYAASYFMLVSKICDIVGLDIPNDVAVPSLTFLQYARLLDAGVSGLPDRRKSSRES